MRLRVVANVLVLILVLREESSGGALADGEQWTATQLLS